MRIAQQGEVDKATRELEMEHREKARMNLKQLEYFVRVAELGSFIISKANSARDMALRMQCHPP